MKNITAQLLLNRRTKKPLAMVLMLSFVDAAATTRALLHHDLDVRLEPESAGLSVIDRVRFAEGNSDDRGLSLLLHRDLALAEVRFGDEVLAVETLRRWRPRDFFDQPDYAELGAYRQARQHVVAAPAGGWPAGEIELQFHYSGAVYDSLHPPDVAYGRGFESTSGLIDPRGAFLSFETFWVPCQPGTGEGYRPRQFYHLEYVSEGDDTEEWLILREWSVVSPE